MVDAVENDLTYKLAVLHVLEEHHPFNTVSLAAYVMIVLLLLLTLLLLLLLLSYWLQSSLVMFFLTVCNCTLSPVGQGSNQTEIYFIFQRNQWPWLQFQPPHGSCHSLYIFPARAAELYMFKFNFLDAFVLNFVRFFVAPSFFFCLGYNVCVVSIL